MEKAHSARRRTAWKNDLVMISPMILLHENTNLQDRRVLLIIGVMINTFADRF